MWSSKIYGILLAGISGIGALTNFKSFLFIKATFNLDLNIFHIIEKDAMINAFCCGLFCLMNICNTLYGELFGASLCNLFCIGLMVPCFLGPLTSFMMSMCRWFQLRVPPLFAEDSKRVNTGINCAIVAVLSYCLAHLLLLPNEFTQQCQRHKEFNSFLVSCKSFDLYYCRISAKVCLLSY